MCPGGLGVREGGRDGNGRLWASLGSVDFALWMTDEEALRSLPGQKVWICALQLAHMDSVTRPQCAEQAPGVRV